ncbi:adaptor protein [Gracilibacillus halophilus YIM-C55.5]|uniref:Adapter protein MecA n=1 Tax=Gracilibacillus halophilus YIM-C55.5 TaxID=1308866 RepID=N4WNW3_9BACI|nr:adaptor protein MecA [Gracilibacillus halophilus]ENH96180.1 adaptor protein [Gracilibacillus halophilus YIM-C55.5]
MEIERINENTIKFYISYMDIEDRGFDREEIWYNRERSEQLFWQVMDEVNYNDEDFQIDGPLWIQVQALEKGLEIVVTKAQISNDGQNLQLPTESGQTIDMPVDDKIESLLEEKFGSVEKQDETIHQNLGQDFVVVVNFKELEDVIQLSHVFEPVEGMHDELYYYDGQYMLVTSYNEDELTDDEQEDLISQILEYGNESSVTMFIVQEYGKTIFEQDALEQTREYFAR